ncbi:MAG TPA: VOC family protein [Steroidobacteraceae bacterium]|nr:VOC family protein [Steroidobacteraceae bacterium]
MSFTPRKLEADAPVRPVPSKLAHLVFRTPRFEEMKRFYALLLGARPVFESNEVCFMTYDDEHHRIGLINWPHLGDLDTKRAGLEHVAFTYRDLPSLLAAYRWNKERGIEPFWTINHGPTISLYYRDPDGNKVELQHDVFARAADLEAFFASGAYEENFMGIVFDPEKMIADYEAGVPIGTLTARPKLPQGASPWDMMRE